MTFRYRLRALSRRTRLLGLSLFSIVLIAITSLTISAWGWLAPATKTEATSSSPPTKAIPITLSQDSAAQERIEAEIITIEPSGFEPTEITRPAKPFMLSVKDHSGQKDLSLQLKSWEAIKSESSICRAGKAAY